MLVGYSSSSGSDSAEEEEQEREERSEAQTSARRVVQHDAVASGDAAKTDDWEPPALQPQGPDGASASAQARRHEARVRSFPHKEGMYPTLVMIPVPQGPTELAALSNCIHHLQQLLPQGQLHPMVPQLQHQVPGQQQSSQQQHQQGAVAAHTERGAKRPHTQHDTPSGHGTRGTVGECSLHISLSHCVPVRFADLELLTGHLRDTLQPCQRPPEVSLQGLTTFCNTDCTRTFLSVPVIQGTKQIVSMTKAVDKSFAVLGLRTFHKDPRPHMSIAWMLGDQRCHLSQAIERLQHPQGLGDGHHQRAQHPQQTHHQECALSCTLKNEQQHIEQQPPHPAQQQRDAASQPSTAAPPQKADCLTENGKRSVSSLGGQAPVLDEPCSGDLGAGSSKSSGVCSTSCELPSHRFPLQAVICRTPQKDHVVWGELPGQGGNASSKRRKV